MRADITRWCWEYVSCHSSKVQRHVKTPVSPIITPEDAFSHIHVDLVGPLPPSRGYTHLFTIIDRTTRWPEAIPLKETSTDTCVNALITGWISWFGVPVHITSDRGSQFTSHLWRGVAEDLGTTLHRTTSYHPQSNGMVERFHRSVKASLRARLQGPDWMSHLPWVLLGLRTCPKEDSAVSPAEAALAHNPMLPGLFIAPGARSNSVRTIPVRHHGTSLFSVPTSIRTASHVFIRVDAHRTPLQRPYQGPFPVIRRDDKTCTVLCRGSETVVSLDRVKPAHVPVIQDRTRSGRISRPPLRYQGGG
jgi:cleavage and polyadenylation specificity factor subunit 1